MEKIRETRRRKMRQKKKVVLTKENLENFRKWGCLIHFHMLSKKKIILTYFLFLFSFSFIDDNGSIELVVKELVGDAK